MNENKLLNTGEMLCRICLTACLKDIISLKSQFEENSVDGLSILDVLEEVMNVEVKTYEARLCNICQNCFSLLKNAYEFKLQFQQTERILDSLNLETIKNNSKDLFEQRLEELFQCNVAKNDAFNIQNEENTQLIDLGDREDVIMEYIEESEEEELLNVIQQKQITSKTVEEYISVRNKQLKKTLEEFNLTEEDLELNLTESELKFDLQSLGIQKDYDEQLINSVLNEQYPCQKCHKIYHSIKAQQIHMDFCNTLSLDGDNNECYICNQSYTNSKQLTQHIKMDHFGMEPLNQNVPKKMVRTCRTCRASFTSQSAFAYHKLKHNERRFVCESCGKTFLTKNILDVHMQTHRKHETVVLCPVCGKRFHYESGLFYHLKMHYNEKKYACELCEKKFYSMHILKRHLRIHTGDRPYSCKQCNGKFKSLGEMKKHEMTHTGVKPYSCKHCRKAFTASYSLKVHLLGHPGMYGCSVCSKTFIDRDSVEFHCKMKHGKRRPSEEEEDDECSTEHKTYVQVKCEEDDVFDENTFEDIS